MGLWLCLAAIVAVTVSHMLITQTFSRAHTSEAERAARHWARFLAALADDPELLAARLRQDARGSDIVHEAMRTEDLFRFRLFGPNGRLLFSSDDSPVTGSFNDLARHNPTAAAVALAGGTLAKSFSGTGGSNMPLRFAEAYAPVTKDGRIIGVTEVYIDQSTRIGLHEQLTVSLSLAIGLIVVGAIGLPTMFLVRRSGQVARAEEERSTQTARLTAAAESTPHGFVMLDHDNKLVMCNKSYQRMYGLPDHLCVCGTPFEAMVPHGIERGILRDAGEALGACTPASTAPGSITKHTWRLTDGRIISVESSPMSGGGQVSVHTDVTERYRADVLIAESEARFRDYAATAADWCWETDADHRFTLVTEGFRLATGVDPAAVLNKSRSEIPYHPGDKAVLANLERTLTERLPFRDFFIRMRTPSGAYTSMRSNGAPRFDADGTFLGYRGTARDVTLEEAQKAELKKAEDELRRRTQLLEEAQRLGNIGNWHYSIRSGHQEWSAQIYSIMRTSPDAKSIRVRYVLDKCLADGAPRILHSLVAAAKTRQPQTVDVKIRCDDGVVIDCAITSRAAFDEAGNLAGFRGTAQDITDRKRAEEQLEHLAFYDGLTGLPNRALFTRRLDALVAESDNNGGALLLVDLDRFKDVNDSLGHAAGDQLLAKVAAMVSAVLPKDHTLARIGGDEFAVIVKRSDGPDAVAGLAKRIIEVVSGPIVLGHGEATIGASIGMALCHKGAAASTLLRNADLALYKAKECGRGRFQLFHEELNGALQHKVRLERDLRRALTENLGLSLEYQPLVDLPNGTITGFEALLRWRHPELGPISPAEFIPIAEGSQLIIDIGRWVLRKSAGQMMAWIDQGHAPREMSVNVSAAQLWHSDLVADVAHILAETGLPPHLLCLELTESLLADPSEQRVRSGISKLKELGIKLALDDFGTDYSSLGYLTQLPFDKLKIDRVFVDGVATSSRRRALLHGIIALGHGLGMTVVGEGAERLEEIEILSGLGCNVAQGYVLSRPLPPAQAIAMADTFEMPKRPNEVHAMQTRLLTQAG